MASSWNCTYLSGSIEIQVLDVLQKQITTGILKKKELQ